MLILMHITEEIQQQPDFLSQELQIGYINKKKIIQDRPNNMSSFILLASKFFRIICNHVSSFILIFLTCFVLISLTHQIGAFISLRVLSLNVVS